MNPLNIAYIIIYEALNNSPYKREEIASIILLYRYLIATEINLSSNS